jgi:hypothetical protein
MPGCDVRASSSLVTGTRSAAMMKKGKSMESIGEAHFAQSLSWTTTGIDGEVVYFHEIHSRCQLCPRKRVRRNP